jgi:hypothetical protein
MGFLENSTQISGIKPQSCLFPTLTATQITLLLKIQQTPLLKLQLNVPQKKTHLTPNLSGLRS